MPLRKPVKGTILPSKPPGIWRMPVDTTHGKNHYANMVTSALACDGAVLIAWQHEDIA